VPRRITRALKCFHGSRVVRGAARIQMLKTKQDAPWRGVLSARIRLPPNRDRLIRISIFVDAPQSAGMANKPRERTWVFCALVSRARERERKDATAWAAWRTMGRESVIIIAPLLLYLQC